MSKSIKNKKKDISTTDNNISQEIDKNNSNKNENIINEENITDNNSNEKKSNIKRDKKPKKSKRKKIILDASKDQSIINNTNTTNSEIISELPKNGSQNEIIISEPSKREPIMAQVIDELPINHVIVNKVVDTIYKIVYVFNNIDYYLKVKPKVKMIDIINKICKNTNMTSDKLCFNYNEYEITEKYYDMTVKEFFNFPINKSRPIIYVKIKQIIPSSPKIKSEYSLFNTKIYPHKVKIINFPETYLNSDTNEDINSIINTFYKELNIEPDFTYERQYKTKKDNTSHINIETNDNAEISNLNANSYIYEENKTEPNVNNKNNANENGTYIVSFPTSNIAFDFNRYMSSLKLLKPKFKDMKTKIMLSKKKSPNKNKNVNEVEERKFLNNYNYRYDTYLEENDLKKRNKIEVLNMISNNFQNSKINRLIRSSNNSSIYLKIQSPYSTPYDERVKDNIENKKKWLYKKGFISSVNKNYSGFNI